MSQMPQPQVWVQRDHLEKACQYPHLSRLAPTKLHPDFQPLYTQAQILQIFQDCVSMADQFELDVNHSGLVSQLERYFGIES